MPLARRGPVNALRLHHGERHPVAAAGDGRRLPRSLLIAPGTYRLWGHSHALTDPGVYRFETAGADAQQRLVPAPSVDELLGDLSWVWAYGTADDTLPPWRRRRVAARRRLSLTCTPLSVDIATLLQTSGLGARVVLVFTREELREGDNGHTLLEVRDSGRWMLYDPTFRTFFCRGGTRLTLPEWCRAVAEDEYEIESVSAGEEPLGRFSAAASALEERMRALVDSSSARRAWYARMAGVPLVADGNHYLFSSDEPLAGRLTAYSDSYRPISPEQFRAFWAS